MFRQTRLLKIISFRPSQTKNYCDYIFKNRFEGKVTVVNGATQGIGFSVAKRFAQEGAKVIISSRKQTNVDEAVDKLASEGLNVTGVVCHVGKKEDRKVVLEKAAQLGGIDSLILIAGANPAPGLIIETDEKLWDKLFDTNIKAQFFFTKEAMPLMKKNQQGSIIFMSTIAVYSYFADLGMYSISKSSLHALTKGLAAELASNNITVNCVAPGVIDTKFIQNSNVEELYKKKIPLKRIGTPEDISGVVTFLASKDARYITGETIVVAGGMLSRL